MFELGFTQLGIFGGIIVAIGLYIMAEYDKSSGLWVLFVGLVIVGAGAVVQLQKVFAESENAHAAKPDETTVARERAYVHVFDGNINHPVGSPPTVSIVIKNKGITNALDVTWRARFIVAVADPPDTVFTFDKSDTSPVPLGVGELMSYQYTFEKWSPEFDQVIEQRKAFFFAFGEIRYKDVFGNARFTDYRLIGGGRYDIGKGIIPGKWGVADKGNASN